MRKSTPAILLLLSACALAAADSDPATGQGGLNLWQLIVQGGWAMWPLGLCSLGALALGIHGARETRRVRFVPDTLVPHLAGLLETRDLPRALEMVEADRTVLSRVLAQALTRARPEMPDANKARVEESIAEGIEHEEAAIGQWINYLNVLATVAPMIGLLGTVSGMIGAFQTISAGGMGRPELLAGDIGEALITTAAGLVIGIPAMVAYFVLRNRLGNQVMATAQTATRLVDHLAGEHAPEAPEE
jgi:biopolymer transport protein ExbB